jgi:phosphonate transport system substrate-binding protein
VSSLVFDQLAGEDPELRSKVRLILKSPPYGMPPMVVPKNIDPMLKQKLLEILLKMHLDPEGKKILSDLRIDRFRVPGPGFFNSVRETAKFWEEKP